MIIKASNKSLPPQREKREGRRLTIGLDLPKFRAHVCLVAEDLEDPSPPEVVPLSL